MITKDKLREYIWADGDMDGYSRSRRCGPITDADWHFLDQMVSAIAMIRRGLVADSFQKDHDDTVSREFDSPSTYKILEEYEMKSEQGGGHVR
jgi:hypothetical protein